MYLAFHVHEGESETYFILAGSGTYNDNGTKYPVKAGDVVFCDDGEGHGLLNSGKGDLTFIATYFEKIRCQNTSQYFDIVLYS